MRDLRRDNSRGLSKSSFFNIFSKELDKVQNPSLLFSVLCKRVSFNDQVSSLKEGFFCLIRLAVWSEGRKVKRLSGTKEVR